MRGAFVDCLFIEVVTIVSPCVVGRDAQVVGEHVDRALKQSAPAVAARVVGELGVDETSDQRHVEVDVLLTLDAVDGEGGAQPLEHSHGWGVRLRTWLETGDGALIHQLVTSQVADREVEEGAGEELQCPPPSPRRFAKGAVHHPLAVGPRIAEHRIVDAVLRLEVGVERRGAHSHSVRNVTKGDLGQPAVMGDVPGSIEDLAPGSLTTFGDSVTSRLP